MSGLTIRNRKQGLIFKNFNNLDDFFFFGGGKTISHPPQKGYQSLNTAKILLLL